MIYCDFEDLRRYHDAVAEARAADVPIGLASLRIIKPGEEGLLGIIAKAQPDAVLVRNLAALEYFRGQSTSDVSSGQQKWQLMGDFSLNIANEITADLFIREG